MKKPLVQEGKPLVDEKAEFLREIDLAEQQLAAGQGISQEQAREQVLSALRAASPAAPCG